MRISELGPEIERIFLKDLRFLSAIICEACGGNITLHAWADLDREGRAVNCPVVEEERILIRSSN